MPSSDDLPALIQASWTQPPAVRPGAVSRRALIERARDGDAALVTVAAPAGFGKTSFLAEWAASEPRTVVWLTLDASDDDPAVLIAELAAGFAPLSPIADRLAAAGPGAGATLLTRAAPLLADAMRVPTAPYLLVLDDIHELRDEACWDVINILTDAVPTGSTLVASGRVLPRRMSRGRQARAAVDITSDDLRLDESEARVVATTAGVTVDDAVVEQWVAQCEGWAAGIHMLALLERDGGGASAPVAGGLLADYLYDQCLASLDDGLRSFLLHCSIAEVMVPALCRELSGDPDAGRILDELVASQLFTTRAQDGGSYRLHGLFREYLERELRLDDPGLFAELHRRAADWFAGHDAPVQAVEHLLAAGERDRAADVFAEIALVVYQSGQVATLLRWIAEIGDRTLAATPARAVTTTWVEILAGSLDRAEFWASVLESLPDADTSDEGWSFVAGRAMVRAAMMRSGLERALADAELAVALEPATSPWRDQALQILGNLATLAGRRDEARTTLRDAVTQATLFGNNDSVLLSETDLALLSIDDGSWDDASRHARHAVEVLEEHSMQGYGTAAYAYAASALVAIRRGDDTTARRHLALAMSCRVHSTAALPALAVRMRATLAECYLALDDALTASMLLDELREPHDVVPDWGTTDARLAELAERCRRAEREADARGVAHMHPEALTVAELRVLPLLQTHLTRAEIAARLFVSPNTVGTHISSIFRKLGVSARGDAVQRAIEAGLIESELTSRAG
jgi:LuxR family maltose regulon positive regulatory protein